MTGALAALALWTAPLPAAASIAGLYETQQMETAAALELQPGGHFRYALEYGAVSERGEGDWSFDGTAVHLTSNPMPPALHAIAIEAAEQCGRTRLPDIAEPISLKLLLSEVSGRTLYFADEGGGEAAAGAFRPGPAVILTGPEGGFTDEERALVRAAGNSVAVSLGPRILRAETAALAALAAYMALAGDWR